MTQAMTLIRAGWGRFRTWRRTRPFWGGFLLAAAGIELLVAPAAQSLILPMDLLVFSGMAGVSGNLIGGLLIVIGVLSWLQPAQHTFFGVVGLMLALVSFVTSNFGGFVIGMLLGIVGGSLVFGWGPEARSRSRGRRRAKTAEAPDEAEDDAPAASEGETIRTDDPGGGTRPLATIALPLAVAVAIASAPVSAPGWPWDWLTPGDDEQAEEQPEEDPSESPSEEPGTPPEETEPGADEGTEEDPEDESEEGEEDEEEVDDEDPDPAACELALGDSAVVEDEQELLDMVLDCQAAQDEGEYPEVMVDSDYDCFRGSTRESGLTADTLTMYGASYDGVVECPTADGPRRYLRLTMSRSSMSGGELWFDDAGSRRSLGLPTMDMEGDVELHVTSMHVRLLGIPLTFTPDFPPPLLLPIMYVTDVDVGEPLASTDRMIIPGLDGRFAEE
ncbi:DUF6114 domain-containing protein [Nocardiopsis sp. JB363]|uniref:DUF6114 domain-containing protein n=1 Tax=Nocardiopsis sp. JB363 TaxID=1434837 RepID=UPI00097A9C8D|nr:DUF6114 domain-containing protein [Nocardiopsis sp. JB363]SIO90905.1 hypothetical protein BQ8420_29050 [Nocardiopsis sp. JB363]